MDELEDDELRDVVLGQAVQKRCKLVAPRVEPELGGLSLRKFVELDAVRLHEVELGPAPEQRAAVHLAGQAHGLPGLLLENTLVARLAECCVHVILVMVRLDLLQAQHLRRRGKDFAQYVLEAVVPRQRPKVAVRVLLLRGVNLGQHVVGGDAEPRSDARPTLRRYEAAFPGIGRPRQDDVGLDHARHEQFPRIDRVRCRFDFELAADVVGTRNVHGVVADLDPVLAARKRGRRSALVVAGVGVGESSHVALGRAVVVVVRAIMIGVRARALGAAAPGTAGVVEQIQVAADRGRPRSRGGVRSPHHRWVGLSRRIPSTPRSRVPWNGVLRLPRPHEAVGIAKGGPEQRALRRDALEGAIGSAECVPRPIVWRKRRPPGTAFVATRFMERPTEPPVRELVRRWWFAHLFGMRLQRLVKFPFVEFLAVHVRVRLHRAPFHRSIDPQRQMPRVDVVLGVHGAAPGAVFNQEQSWPVQRAKQRSDY